MMTNNGGTIPQDIPLMIKHLVCICASNLLSSCVEISCKNCAAVSSSNNLDTSVIRSGSYDDVMNNIGLVQTVFQRYLTMDNYYVGPAVDSFEQFTCDWVVNVNDSYILFCRSLSERLRPFNSSSSLEIVF